MTTPTIQVLAPLSVRVPRAARWVETISSWLSTPLAPTLSVPAHVAEAAQVRELAYRVQDTDPGFASDLLAAASRHENKQ